MSSTTELDTTTTRPGRGRPRRARYWGAAAAAIIMGTGLVTVVTTTNTAPTAGADALCDQMRREHGPYWPCINVPTYTPQPTQNTPPPTAPNPGGPGTGPNAGAEPGPGPGTGNGTPIIPVPGYHAPGLPGQTPPPAPTTNQQPPAPQNPAPLPQPPAPFPGERSTPGTAYPSISYYFDHNRIGRSSPTLMNQYRTLKSRNWTFTFGESGKGSFTRSRTKEIVIDINELRNNDWDDLARPLAHEMGHALHKLPKDPSPDDRLTGEGHAVLNEMVVRDEIAAATGHDMQTTLMYNVSVRTAYAKWRRGEITQEEAARKIGQGVANLHPTTCLRVTYREYYTHGCK